MEPDVIDLSDDSAFGDRWSAAAPDARGSSSTSNVGASSAVSASTSETAQRLPRARKRLTEEEKSARDDAKRHKQEARQKAADDKQMAKQMQRTESQLKRVKQAVESKATAENYLTAIVHEAVLDTATWFGAAEEDGSIERRLDECFAPPAAAAASSSSCGASDCSGARWRRATADDAPWLPHAGVVWQRKMPRQSTAAGDHILYDKILENECLLLASAEELGAVCDDDVALFGSRMAAKMTGKISKCTLLVTGLDKYGADRLNTKQSKESGAQLLSTLLALQMDFSIGHRMVKDAGELATVIRQYHKAVAYGLHKERTQSKALYHLDGSVPKGSEYGSGSDAQVTADWWHKMLMQVPKITESTASAICATYATPWSLVRAFDRRAAGDAAGLLSDTLVARGAGAALTQRRIGPAMANTIHAVMCAQHAHHVVT